ncbi:hypothetical protein [Marininema halotolerans]|uniref:1,4-dihydroxy-6-naphthoate synthase n=1 Tax=Marininema halotolerans TaxID=1155944 RepID=A0A1I6UM17_9BACL|nr:hypothetical protein [Marininema halotolerans]SFT02526.1 hypothetical protein SAMN05444972_11822 [Marininema halotolerans]
MIYDELYCKLFVDANIDFDQLVNIITKKTNGKKGFFGSITTNCCDMSLMTNDDYNCIKKHTKGKGSFLYFRYFLEIDPVESCAQATYIDEIGKLLQSLDSSGFRAVAACDFEEELPNQGFFL